MPGGKKHVVDRLGMEVSLGSIAHQRFSGVLNADTQIVSNRQRFGGGRVGAGFAEWIGPEKLVACIVQFHSGKERMSAIEILHDAGKSAVFITIKSPVIAILEVLNTGLAGPPTRGRAKNQGAPGHVDKRFPDIVP